MRSTVSATIVFIQWLVLTYLGAILAPEPHVLLFRRPKNFDQMMASRAAAPAGKTQAKRK